MKSLSIAAVRAPALLSVLGLALLWQERPEQREAPKEHETELSQRMEKIEQHLKLVRKSLREEGGRSGALAALVEMEGLTLECKSLEPELAATLPEAERVALVSAYRHTMVDFLTRQLELEAAVLDGHPEIIRPAFQRLHDMEDPAHERFAPDEEGEHEDDDPK